MAESKLVRPLKQYLAIMCPVYILLMFPVSYLPDDQMGLVNWSDLNKSYICSWSVSRTSCNKALNRDLEHKHESLNIKAQGNVIMKHNVISGKQDLHW